MKLIFVRHGQTEENANGIIQGHLHGKLSQVGIKQAKIAADALKLEHIDIAYVSELARAKDTANEIMKFHPRVPVVYLPELKERHYGELQGKRLTDEEMEKLDKDEFRPGFRPLGGESTEELYNRVFGMLEKILSKHKNDTVIIVSHSGVGMAIAAILKNSSIEDVANNSRSMFKNGEIKIFEIESLKGTRLNAGHQSGTQRKKSLT